MIEVQVYLDDLSAETIKVELYADPLDNGEPFRQILQRGTSLSGTANTFVYHGTVPANRPLSDYTSRIVLAHDSVNIPLEANYILWYR